MRFYMTHKFTSTIVQANPTKPGSSGTPCRANDGATGRQKLQPFVFKKKKKYLDINC